MRLNKNKEMLLMIGLFFMTAGLTFLGAFRTLETAQLYKVLTMFLIVTAAGGIGIYFLLFKSKKITGLRLTALVLIVLITAISSGIFVNFEQKNKEFEILETTETIETTELETIEMPESTESEAFVDQIWWREVPSDMYNIFSYSEIENFLNETGRRILEINGNVEIIDVVSFELGREMDESIDYGPHSALLKIELEAYENEDFEPVRYIVKTEDSGKSYRLKLEY